ncbi:phosphoenolpyruvate synthase [Meiothermus taiwanensis]|jgi:pyruvate,water dikinase|uniref:Phosphoenolpyruvate synthase n=2 Tax=Meiothermus taiwanensis TaxID=172827 RepID=A0A399E9F1_9DEIN|nr:phosphoenolpyruvate synthase [Meiothermus taiwanensis]AWR85808.1 phosphoenolpyruvate synthase [Meiothermus taiwanensis WR-220]KIQ55374.1 phosphoenolpyruvate synthase [Meiothermus taiwanensis]KZK14964.1 phosphoenolpyruvate synthase [Meiothermus taiwanensis]RIH79799.1 Phosphoenolpyruvate synthase [Meiothermus taiwanensis]
MTYIRWFETLGMKDLEVVGGKNASIGEMMSNLSQAGVRVPGGFATTAAAFREFLQHNHLDQRIAAALRGLDVDNVDELARVGAEIRSWVESAELPKALEVAIVDAYIRLESASKGGLSVAVRSSATAEDLPEASFAGQQETFLNVRGIDSVLQHIKKVFASLYNDRAIAYRVHHGFAHEEVALSAGVQRMVRSDLGASGVAFTLDTESGFRDAIFITSTYGLGELLVQGAVNPDEFYVYKKGLAEGRNTILQRTLGTKLQKMVYAPEGRGVQAVETSAEERRSFSLSDAEVLELAKQALLIEQHYGRPMDIEWAKDGLDGHIYILQARPETVQSRSGRVLERFEMLERAPVLVTGRAVGQRIGVGPVRVISHPREMNRVQPGDVLVADMTDPDWEPVMKKAAAIVTNRGGRTCHAAIVARELNIPAVVGTGNATEVLHDGEMVTVSCAEGDTGRVYAGTPRFEVKRIELDNMPPIPTKIMMNVASPERAFSFASLPNAGVGLARLEFIINNTIGIHPKALLQFEQQPEDLKAEILRRSAGYQSPVDFYREKLAEGISMIAAAFAPNPVIVRMSDFKSNEYAHLLGGSRYEPKEENPMIGFRGAARYRSPEFAEAFALECQAIREVREEKGLTNVWVMIPFVRTVGEAKAVIEILQTHGLERGRDGLKLIMMCEVPSNAILAERFLELFDGFSIGSNDLTQLTLALDRDSGLVADLFSEQDEAVKFLLERAIGTAKRMNKYIGICGQGPSDHPEFALWLVQQGIESISLNPDSVLETWLYLAEQSTLAGIK